jgi:hypothetical protein
MSTANNVPWKRLTVEAVAIIVSILMAFAIDAWWDDRQTRMEEQQILHGLKEEFIVIHEVLTSDMAEHLQRLEMLEKLLLEFVNGPSEDVGPIMDMALLALVSPNTSDIGNGTLDALLNSGSVEILQNRELRARLAAWPGVIGEVWDDQINGAKIVLEIHIPYFISENVAAGAAMSQWYSDWPIPVQSTSNDPDAITRLLDDPKFRVLVEIRYGFLRHLTGEFAAAISAAEEIVSEIDKSIDTVTY